MLKDIEDVKDGLQSHNWFIWVVTQRSNRRVTYKLYKAGTVDANIGTDRMCGARIVKSLVVHIDTSIAYSFLISKPSQRFQLRKVSICTEKK